MKLSDIPDEIRAQDREAPGRIPLGRALIIAALIIALGTFITNTLHDWKEGREQEALCARQRGCLRWEESARQVAYRQGEQYRIALGVSSPDRRLNPEYWVVEYKVQRWYPSGSAFDGSSGRVARPPSC